MFPLPIAALTAPTRSGGIADDDGARPWHYQFGIDVAIILMRSRRQLIGPSRQSGTSASAVSGAPSQEQPTRTLVYQASTAAKKLPP